VIRTTSFLVGWKSVKGIGFGLAVCLVTMMLFVDFTSVRAETRIGFSLRLGRGSGPVWIGEELQVLVKRIQREREAALRDLDKSGRILQPPPIVDFPHWARCQEIAQGSRPDMLVVRMNLAGIKAAVGILKGTFDGDHEDRLMEGFPSGFSPGDWGGEILSDFRFMGMSKADRLKVLKRQEGCVRELFTDLRDEINRDVVWDHHKWERARGGSDAVAVNRAAWNLWISLGCPGKNSLKR